MLSQFPLSLPATLRALTVERGKRTVKLEALRLEQGPQTLKTDRGDAKKCWNWLSRLHSAIWSLMLGFCGSRDYTVGS